MRPDPMEQAAQAGRQLHRFPGGLRLRHNKAISCELPVTRAELAPRLYIPLPRRPGEEAEVLVSLGREDALDRDGLVRLVASINRYLGLPQAGMPADAAELVVADLELIGGVERQYIVHPNRSPLSIR